MLRWLTPGDALQYFRGAPDAFTQHSSHHKLAKYPNNASTMKASMTGDLDGRR